MREAGLLDLGSAGFQVKSDFVVELVLKPGPAASVSKTIDPFRTDRHVFTPMRCASQAECSARVSRIHGFRRIVVSGLRPSTGRSGLSDCSRKYPIPRKASP